jgi:hypothetical protein
MSGGFPIAPLPFPPTTYDQRYFNETIRTLNLYFRQVQNPGPVIGTDLRLLQITTDPGNKPQGTVWHDKAANVLRIVDETYINIPLSGQTAPTAAGTVTP